MKRSLFATILIIAAGVIYSQSACIPGSPAWILGGNTGINFPNSIGTCSKLDLILKTNDTSRVLIKSDGRLFFGKLKTDTSHPHSNSFMQIDGKVACKELVVIDPNKWSDFVFDINYPLLPLKELEAYYLRFKHLPEVPTTVDVKKNGINIAEMDAVLLQKIEELTLYMVELNKRIDTLEKENLLLRNRLNGK